MAAVTTGLTVKEFLELPVPEGERWELVRGEVVRMARARAMHEVVKANAIWELMAYLLQNPIGRVFPETTYQLSDQDAPQPDVSVLLNEQIASWPEHVFFTCTPALVVEVVSSETAATLETKVELYLEKGARTVLVLYPEQRAVRIFEKAGHSRLVRGEEPVVIDWLPGFAVPAARFFRGL